MNNVSVKILCGYKCNQCCPYCDVPKDEDCDFREFEKAKDLILFVKNQPNFYIELEGGETLEYPNIIEWSMQFDVPVYIFTNGTQITKELCAKLNKKAIFRISLDGFEELHNKQKIMKNGENGFQYTMRGIQIAKDNNIPFVIGTTVTEEMLKNMDRYYSFMKNIDAQRIILTTEMFPNDPERLKTKAIWERAYPIIKSWYDSKFCYHSFHDNELDKKNPNLELMLKHDKIELNICGFQTPTLMKFNYNQIDQVKKEVSQFVDIGI